MASPKQRKGVIYEISNRPVSFAVAFFFFFTTSFVFLSAVGATPDPLPVNDPVVVNSGQTAPTPQNPEEPIRLVIKDTGLDTLVTNPESTDAEVLDQALTKGALRYPTSAPLGVDGTTVLFGHSSYLPVVYHQYYKLFDGIQDLKTGAVISVYSGTTEYRYQVTGVKVANATEDVVELRSDDKYLTLVTCNSFAAKTSRFVVTASFIGTYELSD